MPLSWPRVQSTAARRNAAQYWRIPPGRDQSPSKEDDLDTLTVQRPRKNVPLIADNFETRTIRRSLTFDDLHRERRAMRVFTDDANGIWLNI